MTDKKPSIVLAEGPLTKEAILSAAWENNLSPRHEATHKIARLALTNELKSIDQLTGLWNRDTFLQYVSAKTHERDATHTLILMDMVGLGKLNDQEGGQRAGDLGLQEMVKMLWKVFYEDEDFTLGRLGGDEFGLISTWPKKENAEEFAQDLIHRISRVHELHPQVAPIRMWYTEVKAGDAKDIFMPAADPKRAGVTPFVSSPSGLTRQRISSKNYLKAVPNN